MDEFQGESRGPGRPRAGRLSRAAEFMLDRRLSEHRIGNPSEMGLTFGMLGEVTERPKVLAC